MKDDLPEEGTMLHAGQDNPTGESAGRKKEASELRKEPRKILSHWLAAGLLCLGISIVSSVVSIVAYDRYFATRIVAVDIKGFIAGQRDLFVQGKINDDQLKRNIESLERLIENIPSNEVVIMGDAVVRNAETIKP